MFPCNILILFSLYMFCNRDTVNKPSESIRNVYGKFKGRAHRLILSFRIQSRTQLVI
ncbi:hypothetical protein K438DRAFT_1840781 [Mycena galopus ATCC 62051]|nr:hypothetical protein K438DRAFT_1840781 [Mycena galopus ATCC 62051]